MTCNIKLRREGKVYPRTCVTCLKSKRCAYGLDEDSLIETASKLLGDIPMYAIVTQITDYDSKRTYDNFQTYDDNSFRQVIHKYTC